MCDRPDPRIIPIMGSTSRKPRNVAIRRTPTPHERNTMLIDQFENDCSPRALAADVIERLGLTNLQYELPDVGSCLIKHEASQALPEWVLLFISELISQILDAGSERDAVLDNEDLAVALEREFTSWSSNHYTKGYTS